MIIGLCYLKSNKILIEKELALEFRKTLLR